MKKYPLIYRLFPKPKKEDNFVFVLFHKNEKQEEGRGWRDHGGQEEKKEWRRDKNMLNR